MKTSIKIAALFLVASTGIFASANAKTIDEPTAKAAVKIAYLPSNKGVSVTMDKETAGKSIVTIYDQDQNILRKDVFAGAGVAAKGYVLTSLDLGNYQLVINSDHQTVKKNIHVYTEDNVKTFIVEDQQ